MEVIHQNENITHAVLGRGQTIEFKASTSSQIIFLLSTGLYKYPRLAAVREIICNAWDAHIVSGIRDKPVEITINREGELCIRDYGTGIPHDLIGPIYCTAGDSTKKESEDETGGFGLGSKAPFAYADHFKVTSFNGGIKTMYAMALSDSTKQGEPSAKVLYQTTTEETGIEVRMQLKDGDIVNFREIIKRVCYYGDINATLNGVLLGVSGMDDNGSDTSFVGDHFSGDLMHGHKIFVRYGAVIYPLEHNGDYHDELRALQTIIKKSFGGLENGYVILRAPANSVSMVPSREALLYNPRTVATIKTLIEQAVETLDEASKMSPLETIRKIVTTAAIHQKNPDRLLLYGNNGWPVNNGFDPTSLLDDMGNAHTTEQMAIHYVVHNPAQVLRCLQARKFYRKLLWDMATTFGTMNLAFAKKLYSPTRNIPHKTLIRDYITRPLIRGAQRAGLSPKLLNSGLSFHENRRSSYLGQWKKNKEWVTKTRDGGMLDAVPKEKQLMHYLMSPILVIAHDVKIDFDIAINRFFSNTENAKCAYVLKLDKKSSPEFIRKVCIEMTNMGFRTYSIIPHQTAMAEVRAEEARQRRVAYMAKLPKDAETGKAVRPKQSRTSLPSLASCEANGGGFLRDRWYKVGAEQIDDPKIIMLQSVNPKMNQYTLQSFTPDISLLLFKHYKNSVGITNRKDVASRFFAAGAKSFVRTVVDDAFAQLAAKPEIKKYIEESIKHHSFNDHWRVNQFFGSMMENKHFRAKLGLVVLDSENLMWYEILKDMNEWKYRYELSSEEHKVLKNLFAPSVTPEVSAAVERLRSANCKGISDMASVLDNSTFFNLDRINPDASKQFVDFVFTAFNL